MAETKIEDREFRLCVSAQAWNFHMVGKPVASLTQGSAIVDIESEIRALCPRLNVVCIKIAAAIVSAVDASESIASEYIKAPAPKLLLPSLSPPSGCVPVDEGMTLRPSVCFFSCLFADLCSGFCGVFLSDAIAGPRLCSLTHLGPTLRRHFLALHWRNKRLSSFNPSQLEFFAQCQG